MQIPAPEQITTFRDVNGSLYENLQEAQVANAKQTLYELCGGNSSRTMDSEEMTSLILSQIEDFIDVLAAIRP